MKGFSYCVMSLVLLITLGGCGDIGGSEDTEWPHYSTEGIWRHGTESLAMVTPGGNIMIVPTNYYSLLEGWILPTNTTITNGSLSLVTPAGWGGSYTITDGNVTAKQNLSFVAVESYGNRYYFSFDYDSRYERGSSNALLEGYWQSDSGNTYMYVSDGAIYGYDTDTGCTLGGTFRIINETKNLYLLDMTMYDCIDVTYWTIFNFGGYATLSDTNTINDTMIFATYGTSDVFLARPFMGELHR